MEEVKKVALKGSVPVHRLTRSYFLFLTAKLSSLLPLMLRGLV